MRWSADARARVTARWERGQPIPGPVGWALAPLSLLYGLVARLHHGLYDAGIRRAHQAAVPVVSVGNLTVGGAGKTPVTRWLVAGLVERGCSPAVLHGGYGEDEPTLHRRWHPGIPVVARRDRVRGSAAATGAGADVLVLDDAFQHRRLARDLDLVLVAAESWTGTARMLPRGPWREPLRALGRADVICITRKTVGAGQAADVAAAVARHAPGVPVARIWLRPDGWTDGVGQRRQGRPGDAVAVAGVAGPASFLAQARNAGAHVRTTLVYPDHHLYGPDTLSQIRRAAGDRAVVTTAKDAVKLVRGMDPDRVWVLEQGVEVEEGRTHIEEALDRLLT